MTRIATLLTLSLCLTPIAASAQTSATLIGIVQDTLRVLFKPFVQADQGMDRANGGLGLGLALVKGLVELHGGSVAARSAGPGEGAEFVVRLPLGTGAAACSILAPRGDPAA